MLYLYKVKHLVINYIIKFENNNKYYNYNYIIQFITIYLQYITIIVL